MPLQMLGIRVKKGSNDRAMASPRVCGPNRAITATAWSWSIAPRNSTVVPTLAAATKLRPTWKAR